MTDNDLQKEKIAQAIRILNELQLDCWLTFVRETDEQPDPALKLIFNQDVTGHSAFLLTKTGERFAVVARYDEDLVKQAGLYNHIYTDTQDYGPTLFDALKAINPTSIAINFAFDDVAADGLTHGMYLQLRSALKHTPYPQRFISAGPLISRLRSRKTAAELKRMRQAVKGTDELFGLVSGFLRPGVTECETSEMLHAALEQRGLGTAWSYADCPGVKFGPHTQFGHSIPAEIVLEAGFIASLDFGVRYQEYCSDLQRIWYIRKPGEEQPPEVVQRAFAAVKGAIEAGKAVLRPGVAGWQVDVAARTYLVNAGYEEYEHALGHSVGRHAHDGGPLLGPCWPCYGELPYNKIEEGAVYTLELGVMTDRGYVSQEDEVLVTSDGCEWFSQPQEAIYLIAP
ncbi:MAG: Xaa-Pro peptidase family protein [Ktedonobacteraceae bacterium]